MSKRNIGIQLAISVIPFVNLYGFYRVKRLRMAFILNVIISLVSIGIVLLGNQFNFATYLGFPPYVESMIKTAPVYLYFMYRWTKQYNMKVV